MPAPTQRREMQRLATETEIKAVARAQLSQDGVGNVTLRGIARDMGMTAPALYRYFPSLEDLVAAMCQDFFDEITESISAAVTAADESPSHGMHAAIRTFRDWALAHPGEFSLMFGKAESPLRAGGSISDFAAVFFGLYVQMWQAQPFAAPTLTGASAATCSSLAVFAEQCLAMPQDGAAGPGTAGPLAPVGEAELPAGALFVFARTWVRLYGVISMEVGGQLSFMFSDVTPYFETELEDAAAALGVPYVPPVTVTGSS